MNITDTANYKKWINQFEDADKYLAKKLAESICYETYDDVMFGISRYIENLPTSNFPIALYPVFDVPVYNRRLNGQLQQTYKYPFFEETKSVQPNVNVRLNNLGSEAEISHLIRDICKNNSSILNTPTLEELKSKKCHNIYLVNDIAISGEQCIKFFRWFYNNKTIKSWCSNKTIKIYMLIYSASDNAISKLQKERYISQVYVVKSLSYGSIHWDKILSLKLNTLCKKYAKKGKIPQKWAIGFKDSFSLQIFSYKCPNNVPGIIWYNNSKIWIPLIETRPLLQSEFKIETPIFSIEQLYTKLKISIEKKLIFYEKRLPASLIVLSLIYTKRVFNIDFISKYMNLPKYIIESCIKKLIRFNWIDANFHITEEGRIAAKKIRRKKNKPKCIEDNSEIYYPSQLREPD